MAIWLLLVLIDLIIIGSSTTISVSSDSDFVGALTTYNIQIESHNNPTTIQTLFSQWSPNQQYPYESNYAYYLTSGSSQLELNCILKFSQTVIECTLPSSPNTINIRIINIKNPSSTKPYSIQFNLLNSTSTQTITSQLTVTQIQQFDMLFVNYDTFVGATSSTVELFADFRYYITTASTLKIQYDPNVISISFNPISTSGYQVQSSSSGSVELYNWASTSLGTHNIPNITIINPQAGLTFTMTATLYFTQSATNYSIQSYSLSETLQPVSFTSLVTTSTLQRGKTSQTFTLSSKSCPFAFKDRSLTNESYTSFTFDISQISSSTCSNTTSTNSTHKICSFDSDLASMSITGVKAEVLTQSNITIDATVYTYHSGAADYFSLCTGSFQIPLTTQLITSSTFDIGLCSSTKTGGVNLNTILVIELDSWENGDVLTISGIQGSVQSPWTSAGSSYTQTLSSSNFLNSTHISLSLPYANPTSIIVNEITSMLVERPSLSLRYAESSVTVSLCPVSNAEEMSNFQFIMGSSTTYSKTTYTFAFTPTFTDYLTTDTIQIEFLNNNYAMLGGIVVKINGAAKLSSIDPINNIITILNAFDGSTSYSIVISNVLNPPQVCTDCTITVSLLSSSFLKQLSSVTPVFTENTVSISNTPISLFQLQNITVNFSNANRYSYFSNISSSVVLKYPFACSNSTQTFTTWGQNVEVFSITLINCDIGFLLNPIFIQQETISGIASTNTPAHSIELACPANCYQCSSSTTCIQCVNITHTQSIYLYSGACYQSCPAQTYLIQNSTTCVDCHVSCQSCSGSTLTECTVCLNNFQLANQVCTSVCGSGQYLLNGECSDCHINCNLCLNNTYCYQCKESALMITDGQCQFTVCEEPCKTCEGSNKTCLTCTSSLYFYENSCYEKCPEETYSEQNSFICLEVTIPVLYFPATISSIIFIVLAFIGNACINRKMTDSQRKHINVLTYSSSILAYMEIIAIIIVLALTTSDIIALGIVGMVIWIIANILFGIYYFKVVRNDDTISKSVEKMSQRSKCIYYTTIIFSVVISVRTYRVLFCGLFKGVAPYPLKQKQQKKDESKKGRVANQNQNSNEISSASSDDLRISKFELKRPFTIYITLISILGSLLFLITGIIEVVNYQYINMLLWGLDLIIVVFASIVITFFDMWVGIKKSYFLALENPVEVNQTIQNLNQYREQVEIEGEENTQKKMVNKQDNRKPIKTKSQVPKKPLVQSKVPQKKVEKEERKKSISPKRTQNLDRKSLEKKKQIDRKSADGKSAKGASIPIKQKSVGKSKPAQKIEEPRKKKMDNAKNRYSGNIANNPSRSRRRYNQQDDYNGIPDVKVFDDVDLEEREEDERAEKIKKLPKNIHKSSLGNIKSTQFSQNPQQSTIKIGWKLDDIFLGFLDEDANEKKTVRIIDDIDKVEDERDQEKDVEKESYIENLKSPTEKSEIKIENIEDLESEELKKNDHDEIEKKENPQEKQQEEKKDEKKEEIQKNNEQEKANEQLN